jgi:hypothetical protein
LGRLARNWRDVDEDVAAWTLNLTAGELLVTLQMLLAMGTGKLEITHKR